MNKIRFGLRTLLVAALIATGVWLNLASQPGNVQIGPREGMNTMQTDEFFLLGYHLNTFSFSREIYLGKNVRRFRLKLRTTTLLQTSGWLEGLQVMIFSMPGNAQLSTLNWLQTQETDGGLWTPYITGNWARLEISSSGVFVIPGEMGTRLHIDRVEYDWDSSIANTFVPSSNIASLSQTPADATHIAHHNQGRTVGVLPGLNGSQYHFTTLEPNLRYAVYVSPHSLALGNDIGLSVGVSTTGFVNLSSDNTAVSGRVSPAGNDTGVYHEIEAAPGTRTLFLTVRSVVGGTYTLTVNRVRNRFTAVYEMSDGLASRAAPTIERTQYDSAINVINPFGAQHARFIAPNATYLRRTMEMIVLASANTLSASQGYARYGGADIYQSEHTFLNTDVFLHQSSDRAYASASKINLYLSELNDPVKGGATMHHEWGHFEYGMDDEYHEDSGCCTTIDHNSVMGTEIAFNIPRFAFCTAMNHVWRSNWDPTEADGESNWEIFTDKYDLGSAHNAAEGQYHDVLHKLRDLISFRQYE